MNLPLTTTEKCAVLAAWIRNELDRLERLDQAATPAPWYVNGDDYGGDGWQVRAKVPGPGPRSKPREVTVIGGGYEGDGGVWEHPDADATALARNLLAAGLPMLRGVLETLDGWPHGRKPAWGSLCSARLYHGERDEPAGPCDCGLDDRKLAILQRITLALAEVLADELLPVAALATATAYPLGTDPGFPRSPQATRSLDDIYATGTPESDAITGHGHVRPRTDGVKARCGGPGLCSDCSREAARVTPFGTEHQR